MPTYYSPTGNPEVWDYQPEGYFTPEEWEAAHRPPPTLEEAKAAKIAEIDAQTSAAITAGFEYTTQEQPLHFSYQLDDQQNFADTGNAASLFLMGVPGIPPSVTWNGYVPDTSPRQLVRLTLTAQEFLSLYMEGALAHKATQMETGGQRKTAVEAATSIEDLAGI